MVSVPYTNPVVSVPCTNPVVSIPCTNPLTLWFLFHVVALCFLFNLIIIAKPIHRLELYDLHYVCGCAVHTSYMCTYNYVPSNFKMQKNW